MHACRCYQKIISGSMILSVARILPEVVAASGNILGAC